MLNIRTRENPQTNYIFSIPLKEERRNPLRMKGNIESRSLNVGEKKA